ncbi:MAG: arsenic efflux protein [Clostridia bacterium]|nr:arsenic efflux protein [Clostridia bacterium]
MEEFLHVLLHSLIDTAKLLPVLFVVYFLIELLEYKNIFKFEKSKLLKGKSSPVMGALFGSVPQCGFSVISSELYSKRKISIGALIAVFVATSDEALPLMISNYKAIPSLLLLLAVKIVMAIIIGYFAMLLYNKVFKFEKIENKSLENNKENHSEKEQLDEHKDEHEEHLHACCHHDLQDEKFDWKHPLIHCLKITLYIFIFNVVFGMIVELVGEDNLISFLGTNHFLQPLLAVIIGLIPNCVSSVVITELYLAGGLTFGSIVAGLSVNAGIGLIVLFKENKNKKENLFIVLSLIIPSLVFGYLLHLLPINLI